jgi:hypothetical protein
MVTDQQVQRLRRLDLRGLPKERAADKAGLDPKTARKCRRLGLGNTIGFRKGSAVAQPCVWR